MYPTIVHQAHQPWPVFYKFYRDLARLGFGRYPLFHFWFWSVAVVGPARMDRLLQMVRRAVGHTPNISSFARGGIVVPSSEATRGQGPDPSLRSG